MKRTFWRSVVLIVVPLSLAACGSETGASSEGAAESTLAVASVEAPGSGAPQIVVSHSLLGATVFELVAGQADITVLIPNGTDPHEWSPSAKDIATVMNADLVVANGLGLEGGIADVIEQAKGAKIPVFLATEHITIRMNSGDEHGDEHADEAGDEGPEENGHSDEDPHYWMDPLTVKQIVAPLATALSKAGVDVSDRVASVESILDETHAEVESLLAVVPPERRKLVSGHESLGYFADRYNYELIGAVIPSFSSQAEASAGALADLVKAVQREKAPAVFTEQGTPAATVDAIASDAQVEVVELGTHRVPADGTYRTFIVDLATLVANALR